MTVDSIELTDTRFAQRSGKLLSIAARVGEFGQRNSAISRGLLSLIDQAFYNGTNFATAAIVARTASRDELGLYYLTVSVLLFVLGVFDQLVLAPYVIYSKRRVGRELCEYTGSVWVHHLLLTGATGLALVLAIAVAPLWGSADIMSGLRALLGASPLLLLRHGIRRFFLADLHIASAVALDCSVAIAQLAGLVVLVHFGAMSIFNIYCVMGGACGLACLGWFVLDPPSARFEKRRFLSDWQHNWGFAKWALRSYLLGNTTPYIMPWILALAAGTAATGVLGACMTLVGVTNVFLCAVANVVTPQAAQVFARGGSPALRRMLTQAASFLVLVLGPLCLAVGLTGDWLAVIVYGDQFQGCGAILAVLAVNALITSLAMVVGNGLWAVDQPRANFGADLCCMVVTLTSAAVLVVPFGALGAALAMLAGVSVSAAVRTWTLLRVLDSYPIDSIAISPPGTLEGANQ